MGENLRLKFLIKLTLVPMQNKLISCEKGYIFPDAMFRLLTLY